MKGRETRSGRIEEDIPIPIRTSGDVIVATAH